MADGKLPEDEQKVDAADLMAALTFGPSWAREAPKNPYAGREDWSGEEEVRREGRGGFGGGRGGGFGGGRNGGRPGGGAGRRPGGAGGPGMRRDGDRRDGDRRREGGGGMRREGGERRDGERRGGGGERRDGERRPFAKREPVKPMDVRVSFLPNRDVLAKVVRDVQAMQRAFSLIDIAKRFLAREELYDVKLETGPAKDGAARELLCQCQECRRVFRRREAAEAHVLEAHLEKYFDVAEEECEAPAGTFTCVARCRLSGELLGPPNFHGYNERLNELWATRFSHMPKSEYLGNIETVRDEGLVEEWKASQTHRTVYRLKAEYAASAERAKAAKAAKEGEEKSEAAAEAAETAAAAEGAEAAAAEGAAEAPAAAPVQPGWTKKEAQEWLRGQLKGLVREAARCLLPGKEARGFGDEGLRLAVSRARTREGHFPFSLSMALRPAFRHMHLHLFKINARETYVTAVEPKPVDLATAPAVVREIVEWVKEHEGATRKSVLEGLRPGANAEDPAAAEVLLHLGSLVATGGVIEFSDGKLALPKSAGEMAAEAAEAAAEGEPAAETGTEAPPAERGEAEPLAAGEAQAAETPAETPREPAAEVPEAGADGAGEECDGAEATAAAGEPEDPEAPEVPEEPAKDEPVTEAPKAEAAAEAEAPSAAEADATAAAEAAKAEGGAEG